MAETEIEPRVTTDERDKMQKVLDLISSDQMDKAASLLEKAGVTQPTPFTISCLPTFISSRKNLIRQPISIKSPSENIPNSAAPGATSA